MHGYNTCKRWYIQRDMDHRINLTHADKEKHKYIAKVNLSDKKFRYFYDREEYMAYLQSKKSANKTENGKNEKSTKNDSSKKNTKSSKKSNSKKNAKIKNSIDKLSNTKVNSVVSVLLKKKIFKEAIKWVENKLHKKSDKKRTDTDPEKIKSNDENGDIPTTEKKGYKYVGKVKTANGKTRYFYSQDEYDAYTKRLEYQKNEPDFMKGIKHINKDNIYSSKEDMDKVNEVYDPYDPSSSMNCANCSTAYELRRRGYDVEAKLADNSYNGYSYRVYDYFENAKQLYVNDDGSTTVANENFNRKLCSDKGLNTLDILKNKKDYNYYANQHNFTSKSIEKAIKANSPAGSRGFIDVNWKQGGGHSIIYEVDKKGKITIKDSQSYDTYDISELADKVSNIRITRTDNLKLKKDILNAVTTNTDKERKYYIDDWQLYETKKR